MSKKGQKNLRGQPEQWNELKRRVNMTLTPTSIDGLDAIATELGLSRSELVERIGRGMIPIHLGSDEHTAMGKSDGNDSADCSSVRELRGEGFPPQSHIATRGHRTLEVGGTL